MTAAPFPLTAELGAKIPRLEGPRFGVQCLGGTPQTGVCRNILPAPLFLGSWKCDILKTFSTGRFFYCKHKMFIETLNVLQLFFST